MGYPDLAYQSDMPCELSKNGHQEGHTKENYYQYVAAGHHPSGVAKHNAGYQEFVDKSGVIVRGSNQGRNS